MHVSKRKAVALLVVAALAGSATTAISAAGHGFKGHQFFKPSVHLVLATDMIGSVPADGKIHGLTAGGFAWKLAFGKSALFSNGELVVALKGLLITGTGGAFDNTVGPVTTVKASLYCGVDTMGAAATTAPVALSAQGNALIHEKVTLPARCAAPVLLINPNSAATVFIAESGFPTA